jgi:hypothetical protein
MKCASVIVIVAACYSPRASVVDGKTIDATSIDASRKDSAIDARNIDARNVPQDAPQGLASLARAPKTCSINVGFSSVATSFPGWSYFGFTDGRSDIDQQLLHCAEVWGLALRFPFPTPNVGSDPAMVFTRDMPLTANSFTMAYTVESIVQTGESSRAFAGGFALSAVSADVNLLYFSAGPQASAAYSDSVVNGAAPILKDLGTLTPPYRLIWHGDISQMQLSSTLTILTATTTKIISLATIPLPSGDVSLQLGINRHNINNTTKMVISDLLLP